MKQVGKGTPYAVCVPSCHSMCGLGGWSLWCLNSTVYVSACAVISHWLLEGDPGGMLVWGTPLNCCIYIIATSGEGDRSSGNSHSRKNEVKLPES